MKADVSRADLLQYLANAKHDDLLAIADCFGFRYAPPPAELPADDQASTTALGLVQPPPPIPVQAETIARPPEQFCRLAEVSVSSVLPTALETAAPQLPDWYQASATLDLNAPTHNIEALPPPEQTPLVAWSRLWPVLRSVLSVPQQKRRPDYAKLVKTVAAGKSVQKIPTLRRQAWSAGLRILIDRPQRLQLFNPDYLQVLEQLKNLRGGTGFVEQLLDDTPGGPVVSTIGGHTQKTPWQTPEPDTLLLIFSDLGCYERSGRVEQAWLAFGKRLQAAGCTPLVLMPVPDCYVPPELTQFFQCLSWDRFSPLTLLRATTSAHTVAMRKHAAKLAVTQQLHWLSPFLELQPALLRQLRHLWPQQTLGVNFEAEVWNHEQVSSNTTYCHVTGVALASQRTAFLQAAQQHPAQARLWYDIAQRHHGSIFLLDYYEELITLATAAGCMHLAEPQAAVAYIQQFVKAVHEFDAHGGLAQHGRALLARQAEPVQRQHAELSSLWAIIQSRSAQPELWQPWLDPSKALPFITTGGQGGKVFTVVLQGETLVLSETPPESALIIASFTTYTTILVAETDTGTHTYRLPATPMLQWPVAELLLLHVDGHCYMLVQEPKPSWATSIGRDQQGLFVTVPWLNEPRLYWHNPTLIKPGVWAGAVPLGVDNYGLYADVSIKGIIQRFRWIEAGSFLMGSPLTEAERYDNEQLHLVTLSQGYWLADTACTQALWMAVMGENPSYFKQDLNNPVEKVSWHKVQDFIKVVNSIMPELQVCLPSEAQWEYACRAGKKTAFSYGDTVTPEQVNYDGNFPYPGSNKGLYREKTVAVKSLPANPWGLYEMHGNVWEWCQDIWTDHLSAQTAYDPKGPETGPGYVVRGGSWHGQARSARSASRYWYYPDIRYGPLSFRLAFSFKPMYS